MGREISELTRDEITALAEADYAEVPRLREHSAAWSQAAELARHVQSKLEEKLSQRLGTSDTTSVRALLKQIAGTNKSSVSLARSAEQRAATISATADEAERLKTAIDRLNGEAAEAAGSHSADPDIAFQGYNGISDPQAGYQAYLSDVTDDMRSEVRLSSNAYEGQTREHTEAPVHEFGGPGEWTGPMPERMPETQPTGDSRAGVPHKGPIDSGSAPAGGDRPVGSTGSAPVISGHEPDLQSGPAPVTSPGTGGPAPTPAPSPGTGPGPLPVPVPGTGPGTGGPVTGGGKPPTPPPSPRPTPGLNPRPSTGTPSLPGSQTGRPGTGGPGTGFRPGQTTPPGTRPGTGMTGTNPGGRPGTGVTGTGTGNRPGTGPTGSRPGTATGAAPTGSRPGTGMSTTNHGGRPGSGPRPGTGMTTTNQGGRPGTGAAPTGNRPPTGPGSVPPGRTAPTGTGATSASGGRTPAGQSPANGRSTGGAPAPKSGPGVRGPAPAPGSKAERSLLPNQRGGNAPVGPRPSPGGPNPFGSTRSTVPPVVGGRDAAAPPAPGRGTSGGSVLGSRPGRTTAPGSKAEFTRGSLTRYSSQRPGAWTNAPKQPGGGTAAAGKVIGGRSAAGASDSAMLRLRAETRRKFLNDIDERKALAGNDSELLRGIESTVVPGVITSGRQQPPRMRRRDAGRVFGTGGWEG